MPEGSKSSAAPGLLDFLTWGQLSAARQRAHRPKAMAPEPVGLPLEEAFVDCALYVDGVRSPDHLDLDHAVTAANEQDNAFVWIGLHDPNLDAIRSLGQRFGLHPLALEDALHAHQRPKVESFMDSPFVVLKTVRYVDHEEVIETGDVMVFVGAHFVITVRHGSASALAEVRHDLEANPALLAIGPSVVLYAVADRVVDDYAGVIDAIMVDIDEIEQLVFTEEGGDPTKRLYTLKREVLEFRRAVSPLGVGLTRLAEGGVAGVDTRTAPYFRDVQDHALRAAEQISAIDELLTGAVQANLAQVSMRQNDDMRKISAYGAILGVLTLIAGVYGMNFHYIPELSWHYGYFICLGTMAVLTVVLYRGFKRSGWL
jgi:magnesium transporter